MIRSPDEYILKQGNCFILRITIVSVCEVYVRARFTPFDISHAGEKRGQENQSDHRPSVRFWGRLSCCNTWAVRNLAFWGRSYRFKINHCATHPASYKSRRKKRAVSPLEFNSKDRSATRYFTETVKQAFRERTLWLKLKEQLMQPKWPRGVPV